MTALHRIVLIALFSGLAHSPVCGVGFEPLSIPEIARQLGIGHGPGYHARPCNPLRARYYNRVTNGAAPFGHSDLRLESFDHTHPFYADPFPVDVSHGYVTCHDCQQAHGQISSPRLAAPPLPPGHRPLPNPVWLHNFLDPRKTIGPPNGQRVQLTPQKRPSQPMRAATPPLHSTPRTATRNFNRQ